MLFDSARLSCRKMTMDDAELYHTWRNDLEVMQSTSPSLDTYQMEETKDFVQHVILGTPSSKSYLIQAKETGQPASSTKAAPDRACTGTVSGMTLCTWGSCRASMS